MHWPRASAKSRENLEEKRRSTKHPPARQAPPPIARPASRQCCLRREWPRSSAQAGPPLQPRLRRRQAGAGHRRYRSTRQTLLPGGSGCRSTPYLKAYSILTGGAFPSQCRDDREIRTHWQGAERKHERFSHGNDTLLRSQAWRKRKISSARPEVTSGPPYSAAESKTRGRIAPA